MVCRAFCCAVSLLPALVVEAGKHHQGPVMRSDENRETGKPVPSVASDAGAEKSAEIDKQLFKPQRGSDINDKARIVPNYKNC